MSKQYLSEHTIDGAHHVDIYSLAVTPGQILSASGESSIKIYSTTRPSNPALDSTTDSDSYAIAQVLKDAHMLGCHHLLTSESGTRAASVGFGGEVRVWRWGAGRWEDDGEVEWSERKRRKGRGEVHKLFLLVAGDLELFVLEYVEDSLIMMYPQVWAVALSSEGRYLAGTTHDGKISVWDLDAKKQKFREYETKGSFGMSIDLSSDGRFTASGHEDGSVFIFSNDTSRLLHKLPGLVKTVRAVAFSPGGKLLAAAGDARIIALYDYASGEQVANLTGHGAWITSLDWSHTGEYLLSGSLDGKVKVWSVDQRACVATHSEADKALWSVKWLPKTDRNERFATAGSNCSISFYREATGG